MKLFKKRNEIKRSIIKTSKEAIFEEEEAEKLEIKKKTCPECGHYNVWNGITESYSPRKGYTEYFKCKKCHCQWEFYTNKKIRRNK